MALNKRITNQTGFSHKVSLRFRCDWLAVLVLVFLVAAVAGKNEIRIERDTLFSGDFTVPSGVTCIVSPGVTISFGGYNRLVVEGVLLAEGTRTNPVLFTCANRARGSVDQPAWKGLEVGGRQAYGRFVHCRFEGAYRNLVWEAAPVFDSCEFVGNHYALYCARKASPHISNSSFYRNHIAVFADFASPLLLDNTISENVIGVYLQLNSEGIVGRNRIENNDENIRSENAFGGNKGSTSLHGLWNVVNQLY